LETANCALFTVADPLPWNHVAEIDRRGNDQRTKCSYLPQQVLIDQRANSLSRDQFARPPAAKFYLDIEPQPTSAATAQTASSIRLLRLLQVRYPNVVACLRIGKDSNIVLADDMTFGEEFLAGQAEYRTA